MAAKLDAGTVTLIEALVREGLSTAEIHRKVSEGSANVAPISVSLRTIQARVSHVRDELRPDPDPLLDADEITVLDAINRGWLRTIHREERRLNAKSKAGKLTDADREAMRRDARVALEIRRYFSAPHSSASGADSARSVDAAPASILDRIRAVEAERSDNLPPEPPDLEPAA